MTEREEAGLLENILNLGEDRFADLVNSLLSNDRFVKAIHSTVSTSIAARGTVTATLSQAFTAMNIPTLTEVMALRTKLDDLDEALGKMETQTAAIRSRTLPKKETSTSGSATSKAAKKKTRTEKI